MAQYTSPGAAFSNTLEDALAAQANTKRQAMLDKLAAKREDRLAQAELDSMQEKRDALAEHKQDIADKAHDRDVADFEKRVQMMVPGDVPDKEMKDKALKLGMAGQFFKPSAPVQVPGPTESGQPLMEAGPDAYVGNRADREAATKLAGQKSYAEGLPAGPLKDEATFALQMGRNPTASTVATPKPPTAIYGLKPGGKGIEQVGEMPAGSVLRQETTPKVSVNVGGGGEDAVSRFVTKSGPAAVDMMAKKIAMGGEAPVLGMMSKNEKSDIIAALNKRAAEFDTAQRMFIDDPKFDKNKPRAIPDLVSQKAKVHALTSELTKLKGMQGAVNSFSASADMNAQALTDTLDKLPEGGAKFLNAPLRDFASQFGDENMAAFGVFRNSVQNEYNRLISNPNLTGVVAQKSKDDMETLLNPNSPVKALRSALKALQKESKNRKIGLDNEVGSVEDEISGNPPKAKSVEDYRKKYNY